MTAKQVNMDGEAVGILASIEKRSRPSVRIRTQHFEIKRSVKTLRSAREKGPTKMEEYIDIRDDKKDLIPNITKEQRDNEYTALLEAALHSDLFPDHDEDWVVLQQGERVVE